MPNDLLLGFNRLSIIDLSPDANQPLWDSAHRRCVVLNGEIYNYVELREELSGAGYQFRTSSDTEVLLTAFEAWGEAAVDRLKGMFAFAIYEPESGRMWLARDRFGVKPLFYRSERDRLLFSSTPGPIARACGCAPNLDYVARGLHHWLYETDDAASPYAGVLALRAGHLMTVERSPSAAISIRERRYYDLSARVKSVADDIAPLHDSQLVERFTDFLTRAVDLRLRSDVPVGVSLSGGLDSSSILALASARTPGIAGFSFGNPSVPATEGPRVREITRFLGAEAQYVWPTTPEVSDAFDATLEAQDAPFNDLSIVAQFLVFRAARQAGTVVMLGGQGADETLMGYRKYQLMALRDAARRASFRSVLREALATAAMTWAELGQSSVYVRQVGRYLGGGGLRSSLRLESKPLHLSAATSAQDRQVGDVLALSLPTLLRYEDRNSMGNSVESRLPFMDHELVELSIAMPTAAKLRRGYGKWVLRAAMRSRVPPSVLDTRRKVGFTVQQEAWLRGGLGTHLRSRIRSASGIVSQLLPHRTDIDAAFSDQRLARTGTAFADATALIWLGERL